MFVFVIYANTVGARDAANICGTKNAIFFENRRDLAVLSVRQKAMVLVGQGIDSSRLTSSGKGKSSPVSDNGTSTGRQQNRRVEVIIDNNRGS